MTLVLMNAQVVGWKLPPYSHLKRSVREIERSAQRGGELLKDLLRQFPDGLPVAECTNASAALAVSATCSEPEVNGPARRRAAHNRM